MTWRRRGLTGGSTADLQAVSDAVERADLRRVRSCECPPVWQGILPPPCRVHNPSSERTMTTTTTSFETYESNPLRQRQVTGAVKDNLGKSRVDLLPFVVLVAVGRVLGFGAAKYKPNNWRLGLSWSDTIASALRHIFAFAEGEDIDSESGQMHVDNAIAQLMFLSHYWHTRTGKDDRWSSLPAEEKEQSKA